MFLIYIYLETLRYHFFWPFGHNGPLGGTRPTWAELSRSGLNLVFRNITGYRSHFLQLSLVNLAIFAGNVLQPTGAPTLQLAEHLCGQLTAASHFCCISNRKLICSSLAPHPKRKCCCFPVFWFEMALRDCSKEMITRLKVTGRSCSTTLCGLSCYPLHIPTSLLFPGRKDSRTCQILSGTKCVRSFSPTARPKRTSC